MLLTTRRSLVVLLAMAPLLATVLLAPLPVSGAADTPQPLAALARMRVREVTVFKDGHALVLHQGSMPTDSAGNVVMDYLPTPMLGTFWPFSNDVRAHLLGVTSSQHTVIAERTALNSRELLESNQGAEAMITETSGVRYSAVILGTPVRSSEELARTNPPGSDEALPEKGEVILLKTDEGVKVIPIAQIRDVTFKQMPKLQASDEEFRNLLTLKLDWGGRAPEKTADVGLLYVQNGLRWIPSYKVNLDGNGHAAIQLEATLVNDMTDLDDVSANLVIGVPTFAFAGMNDPISLQQAVESTAAALDRTAQTGNAFSNAIMAQAAAPGGRYANYGPPAPAGPPPPESSKNEDLFIFTAKHITLKKGQRLVLPIAAFDLNYKDVYALDIPYAPPAEISLNLNSEQQQEVARLLKAPGFEHKIRLANNSPYPLTTAPAMILRNGQIIAQGLMEYTAAGASGDLNLTRAVNVRLLKHDGESKRTPNSVVVAGVQYSRIDLAGSLNISSSENKPIHLEITRHLLGEVDSADHDGVVEKINLIEDTDQAEGNRPVWWNYYGWPNWWHQLNGIGRIKWTLDLDAGKSVELAYSWHYFWR